jgi:hypothetical protein
MKGGDILSTKLELISIDSLHNLVIFPNSDGIYRSQILKFPDDSSGHAVRTATYFQEVPEQESVQDCYLWAYNYVKENS